MNAPSAIIAEDEPLLRREIRDTLRSLWPELRILAEVGDGAQATAALQDQAPDIAFLDIQMPGYSGLEVARHASGRVHVVFVTAFDEHALAAFEGGALDYIVKPITPARMKVTVERLRQRLRATPAELTGIIDLLRAEAGTPRYLKWLTVPHGEERRVLAVSDISYLRADNKYTTLISQADSYLLNSPLREIYARLDPEQFWKIHRSIIVNVSAIESIHRAFRGSLEIRMKNSTELLPVSAQFAHLFKHS